MGPSSPKKILNLREQNPFVSQRDIEELNPIVNGTGRTAANGIQFFSAKKENAREVEETKE
jgi:hypothetical protein